MLYFVAYRVLGNHTDAEEAVQSCIVSISRNVQSLEHEASFRAWSVRVLIDEAVAILRKNRIKPSTSSKGVVESLAVSISRTGDRLPKGPACGLLINPPSGQFKGNASWTGIWSSPDGTPSEGGRDL
jgi:hypothetical protein